MRKVIGLGRRRVARGAGERVAAAMLGVPLSSARAATNEVRIAQQFGLTYLPLIVAPQRKLIEAQAKAAGLEDLKVTWVRLGGRLRGERRPDLGQHRLWHRRPRAAADAVDKTRSNLDVRGVLSLDASAVSLNVNRPELKTLADLKDTDRIALPAVKVSHQAVLLQMAAAKAFGADQYTRFDKLTVTLPHPEAYIALLSGKSEITGHFGNSPFIYQELDDPKIHRLLSSEEILGGLGTVTSVFTTAKVRDANPRVYKAVLNGLLEAVDLINKDKALAARICVEEEKSKLPAAYVQKLLEAPSALSSAAPVNSFQFAAFMSRTGALKNKPASWRDYFFPDIHALAGG